ncbi:MAG: DUF2182 domain-containing protein, partial [Deltaproteobacteria bacterium]|nr:DUF2182 domain-containing protein [Deltaproteobacteria bacterium]
MAAPVPALPLSLPQRDRLAILAGLGGATALAWVYLVVLAAGMDAMPLPHETAHEMANEMLRVRAWTPTEFALMFLMWAVMMVGMMVPSAAPTVLIYAAVARKALREGTPVAPTAVFVSGYVAMWTVFSLGATLAQLALDRAALLSPMMVATSPALGGALLVAAGVYQLTPFKESCLRHCRAPAAFIAK